MRRADGYGIVVVGGGPAGVTAALRARELGASVALVERGNIGGTCTNDGCVPTRVLAHAARLARDAGQFTGRMMLVQSATYEGALAAENAARGAEQGYRHAIVPHGGFTDPEYAGVA